MWQQNEEKYTKNQETAAETLPAAGSTAEMQQQKQHLPTFLAVDNLTTKLYDSSLEDVKDRGSSSNNSNFMRSDEIKKLATEREVVDSGMISGSISIFSENYLLDEEEENIIKQQQLKEQSEKLAEQQLKDNNFLLKESGIVLDSGCIESEEEYDDYETEEEEEAVEENKEEKEDLEGNNLKEENNQMRFKNNIDSGLTERFCSLSLTGGNGTETINNLNSTTRRHSTVNPTTRTNIQPPEQKQQTMVNDWEEFYQQDSEGDTPLHLACLAGAEDVVLALLRIAVHPSLFNIRNYDSQTPLHMAAFGGQSKILRILLLAGADPTIRDRHGNTALHILVNCGKTQCVKALITPIDPVEIQDLQHNHALRYVIEKTPRFNMDLEIRNYDGERCVHLAAQEGYIEILRLLVKSKADINSGEGKSGRTPLHIAIENCNEILLTFLLEECQPALDLEAPTFAGLTAYQFAGILDKPQFQDLLEKGGAEILTPPESDYDDDSDIDDYDDYY